MLFHSSPPQSLTQISGFDSLVSLEELNIIGCLQLVSIDGLSRISRINKVMILHTNSLCYILNSTADAAYWKVSIKHEMSRAKGCHTCVHYSHCVRTNRLCHVGGEGIYCCICCVLFTCSRLNFV